MSILIHGMTMPTDGCKSCAFDIYGSCLIKANMDKPYEVTHSCPLVELPPHGRFGDLDALERNLREMADYQHGDRQQGILGCCNTICSAHTIIPADPEGGENNG